MNNRVDYLSDRLVNLRGKHKTVNDVLPPASAVTADGSTAVSANAPQQAEVKKTSVSQAQERRREQTVQLYNDFEQRLVRRQKQAALRLNELEQQTSRLRALQNDFSRCAAALQAERFVENEELTASALGERFRNIDRTRLEFFQIEAELEMLMNNPVAVTAASEERSAQPESFTTMLKRGAAWALTAGVVLAAAILLAAAMLYAAWS